MNELNELAPRLRRVDSLLGPKLQTGHPVTNVRPGTELLQCYLGKQPVEPVPGAIHRLSDAQWSAVVDSAIHHGVAPLLYTRLQAIAPVASPPDQVQQDLCNLYLHNALRNATVFTQLAELLAALRNEGIPVITLKGAHLATSIYPDPALRPMEDLDLLIRHVDLGRAERLMGDLGYSPMAISNEVDYDRHHHLRPFCKSGAILVEIHRTIEAKGDLFAIDVDRFWERAQEAEIAGVKVHVLSPEDLLLHLCVHAAYNHRFKVPLINLCDIAEVIRRYQGELDWQRLAATADEFDASRFIYCTLSVVHEILNPGIPPQALAAIIHNSGDEELVQTIRQYMLVSPEDLPVAYTQLGENGSLSSKVHVLARSLFPTPETLRRIYAVPAGSKLLYWYYLIRPVDLLIRRGKIMLEIATRAERVRPALEREKKRQQIRRWVEERP